MSVLLYLAWSMFCFFFILNGGGIHLWMGVIFLLLLVFAYINTPISPQDARRWLLWHRHHRHHHHHRDHRDG